MRVGTALILVFGLLVTAVAVTPNFGSSLKKSFGGITNPRSDDTASWRMEGWKEQLGGIAQNKELLLGEGVGGYYSWYFKGNEVTVSPHNAYVLLLLKFGLVGLIIYGLFVFKFFRKTLRVRRKMPPGYLRACVEIGIVNVGAAHAYMIGYGIPLFMLIFCAVSMSAVKLQRDT